MTLFSCLGLCKTKKDQLKVDCRPTAENCLEINDTQIEYSKLMKSEGFIAVYIVITCPFQSEPFDNVSFMKQQAAQPSVD